MKGGRRFLPQANLRILTPEIIMATHNSARIVGYLLEHPKIANEGQPGAEKAFLHVRTIRRDADDVDPRRFEDIFILYDGDDNLMQKIKKLRQFDLIDVKGVFNIVSANKPSRCPYCGNVNIKYQGTYSFVYPQHLVKLNNILECYEFNPELPDAILSKHYKEVSNYLLVIGTVVSKPEMIGNEKHPCCKYKLGVNRKFYIKTQSDVHSDYPWVYSRGQQALDDYKHLEFGSIIIVDGYIHIRNEKVPTKCEQCKSEYSYPDIVTDFIPYSIEYLKYKTDEDIAREEELERRGISISATN